MLCILLIDFRNVSYHLQSSGEKTQTSWVLGEGSEASLCQPSTSERTLFCSFLGYVASWLCKSKGRSITLDNYSLLMVGSLWHDSQWYSPPEIMPVRNPLPWVWAGPSNWLLTNRICKSSRISLLWLGYKRLWLLSYPALSCADTLPCPLVLSLALWSKMPRHEMLCGESYVARSWRNPPANNVWGTESLVQQPRRNEILPTTKLVS